MTIAYTVLFGLIILSLIVIFALIKILDKRIAATNKRILDSQDYERDRRVSLNERIAEVSKNLDGISKTVGDQVHGLDKRIDGAIINNRDTCDLIKRDLENVRQSLSKFIEAYGNEVETLKQYLPAVEELAKRIDATENRMMKIEIFLEDIKKSAELIRKNRKETYDRLQSRITR